MRQTEIIDQLRCLNEFCQAQIQPDANRMWVRDVEALTAVIEQLEQDQWISVEKEMPKEHDSMFERLYGTDQWINGMFRKVSDEVLITIEFASGKKKVTTCRTLDGRWRLPCVGNQKVTHWKPSLKPADE